MKPAPAVALLALLLVCAGCGDTEGDTTGLTDRDARFVTEVGERFEVVLESNPTTGFGWELSARLPTDVLVLTDQRYVPPDTDLIGAGGYEVLTFDAIGNGSTFIQLWYIRPFDDPPEPADRAQFEVIVGTGVPDQTVDPADIDEPVTTVPDDENALTVPEIVALTGPVTVRGLVLEDLAGMFICETLAESFPPQCGGTRVAIANPAAVDADFTQQAGVRWTDRPTVLAGEMVDGTLLVDG